MKKLYAIFFVSSLLLLTACRNTPGVDKLSTNPIVVTQYDVNAKFSGYKTFSIPDTISLLDDNKNNATTLDADDANKILSAIINNMTSRGYTKVPFTATGGTADLVIIPTAVKNLNLNTIYYPGYWWGYYPYYDWIGWWGGGGYYPGYSYTYSYQTGLLSIEMFDRTDVDSKGDPRLIWNSYSGGILNNNPISDAVYSVNQSFTQSSYIIR